jgi:hypothetical protein
MLAIIKTAHDSNTPNQLLLMLNIEVSFPTLFVSAAARADAAAWEFERR